MPKITLDCIIEKPSQEKMISEKVECECESCRQASPVWDEAGFDGHEAPTSASVNDEIDQVPCDSSEEYPQDKPANLESSNYVNDDEESNMEDIRTHMKQLRSKIAERRKSAENEEFSVQATESIDEMVQTDLSCMELEQMFEHRNEKVKMEDGKTTEITNQDKTKESKPKKKKKKKTFFRRVFGKKTKKKKS